MQFGESGAAERGFGNGEPLPPVRERNDGFIPIWTNGTTLGSSVLFQSGTGAKAKLGIGTTKPASTLDVKGGGIIRGLFSLPTTGTATTYTGFDSQPMDLAASVFNSSTSTPVTQTFQWQAEPVGNDTSSASGSLNLLFAEGSGKFAETGLNIASNGQITFATGQSGSGLSNVDASQLGGLAASAFAQLAAADTFTANQTVNGNVSATQLVSTVAQGTAPLQSDLNHSGTKPERRAARRIFRQRIPARRFLRRSRHQHGLWIPNGGHQRRASYTHDYPEPGDRIGGL